MRSLDVIEPQADSCEEVALSKARQAYEMTGEHMFHDSPYRGKIAAEVHEITESAPWSDLFKIFIPEGSNSVLGNMTAKDKVLSYSEGANKYTLFVDWLKAQTELQ